MNAIWYFQRASSTSSCVCLLRQATRSRATQESRRQEGHLNMFSFSYPDDEWLPLSWCWIFGVNGTGDPPESSDGVFDRNKLPPSSETNVMGELFLVIAFGADIFLGLKNQMLVKELDGFCVKTTKNSSGYIFKIKFVANWRYIWFSVSFWCQMLIELCGNALFCVFVAKVSCVFLLICSVFWVLW